MKENWLNTEKKVVYGAASKMTYNIGDWKYGIYVKKCYTQLHVNLGYLLLP